MKKRLLTLFFFLLLIPPAVYAQCNGTVCVTLNADPIACGSTTTSIVASASGGTAPYTYKWISGYTADSINLGASKDNTIYSANMNNSNGSGIYMAVGTTNSFAINRGLIAFNLNPAIPAGSVITSAKLSMHVSLSGPAPGPWDHELHKVLAGWGEGSSNAGTAAGIGANATTGDATWINRLHPSNAWIEPGGDFEFNPSAAVAVGGTGTYTWHSNGMASDVQFWLNNPSQNFGWLIKTTEDFSGQARRYNTRENAGNAPVLRINYQNPIVSSTGNSLNNVTAGTYTIVVLDANQNVGMQTITIVQPLCVDLSAPAITCATGTTSISASVSGGTGPYTVQWISGYSPNTVSIPAVKDNTIYASSTSNSNGGGEYMAIGTTNSFSARRGLIAFDLGSAVDPGSIITNAALHMYVSLTSPLPGPFSHELHKLLENWGEGIADAGLGAGIGTPASPGDATWQSNFEQISTWTYPGGTFVSTASAATPVGGTGSYTWTGAGLIADIQDWVNHPAVNFGWLAKSTETAAGQARRYDSREGNNPPSLDIDFQSPVIASSGTVLANVSAGTYTVLVTDANMNATTKTITITQPPNCGTTLNLTCFIQGFWDGSSAMFPALMNQGQANTSLDCDTITVELHNDLNPGIISYTCQSVLHTNGTATCLFPGGVAAGDYYLAIKHRNTIETWSASPVTFSGSTIGYNFSTAQGQAYGGNQVEVSSGIWAFYSGDVVKDAGESIDLIDLGQVETEVNNFSFGYFAEDLNGDGNVDILDSPAIENSISNFIYANHP